VNDKITEIYTDADLAYKVRYINLMKTSLFGKVYGMYVFDGFCHLFTNDGSVIQWNTFDASPGYIDSMLLWTGGLVGGKILTPTRKLLDFNITYSDMFRFANRDLSHVNKSMITDAYVVKCENGYWYLSELDAYLYTLDSDIVI
jgi:hypothetical protein